MEGNLKHTTEVRVRYGETDQMGFCYYGNYAQFLEDKKIAISKAQVCGIDPNAPGCQAFFPDGKFVNGITN